MDINLPKDYPFKAPKVTFQTPLLHPNFVSDCKEFCCCNIQILREYWSPVFNIVRVLQIMRTLLAEPHDDNDGCDAGDAERMRMFKTDREQFY